jgi:SAM-dependent methyltransferase
MDLSERGAATRRHPWEVERFRAYRDVLAAHGALDARRVLDVGAGDGWFSEMLVGSLPHVEQVVCWDINYHDLELVTDDPRLVRTTEAPAPGFDLVLVLDVIEHVENPRRFVDEQLAPLTPTGTHVLVAVPAHPLLFGDHDRALGHHRRYRRAELLDQVAGWIDVVDQGPLFPSLVAPRAAAVAIERVSKPRPAHHGVGGWHGGPAATAALSGVLRADTLTVRSLGRLGRRLPGLSSWVYGTAR